MVEAKAVMGMVVATVAPMADVEDEAIPDVVGTAEGGEIPAGERTVVVGTKRMIVTGYHEGNDLGENETTYLFPHDTLWNTYEGRYRRG